MEARAESCGDATVNDGARELKRKSPFSVLCHLAMMEQGFPRPLTGALEGECLRISALVGHVNVSSLQTSRPRFSLLEIEEG